MTPTEENEEIIPWRIWFVVLIGRFQVLNWINAGGIESQSYRSIQYLLNSYNLDSSQEHISTSDG